MKGNDEVSMKRRIWLCFGFVFLVGMCLLNLTGYPDEKNAYDLTLRYNEVCCSHNGINPFDVWSHKIESPDYVGHPRPDMQTENPSAKRVVHSYPPWHTTFFWFYGWLSHSQCVVIMSTIFILSFFGGIFMLSRYIPWGYRSEIVLMLLLSTSSAFVACLGWRNYGCLIFGLLLVLLYLLELRKDVLAGMVWALMMIKPQVSMLFFLPLLFQKRYKVIVVAVSICLAGTIFPALVYGISPVELILQISKIGEPYVGGFTSPAGVMVSILGSNGLMVWPGLCFVITAVLSWKLRNKTSWIERFVPALFMFQYWTYSAGGDGVVAMPLMLVFILMVYEMDGTLLMRRIAKGCVIWILCASFFELSWHCVMIHGWLSPTGLGWIYRLNNLMITLSQVILLTLFVRKSVV